MSWEAFPPLQHMGGEPKLEISSHNLRCLLDNQFRFLIRWAFKGLSQRKHVSLSATSENITIKIISAAGTQEVKQKHYIRAERKKYLWLLDSLFSFELYCLAPKIDSWLKLHICQPFKNTWLVLFFMSYTRYQVILKSQFQFPECCHTLM